MVKIFILGSYGPSLVNFRGDMIRAMIKEGYEVIACAPNDSGDIKEKISDMGARYLEIEMHRTGMNPFKDLAFIKNLYTIIKKEKPDIFISYTIKPNIYGTIAAYLSGVKKIYGMMTGSGSLLRESTRKLKIIQKIIIPLYRYAFSKCKTIFFLNEDDLILFKDKKIIKKQKTIVIGSSGVNLNYFSKKDYTNYNTFLFIARLIRDKGIFEFLEAAEKVKKKYPEIKFNILGPFDTNPTAIKHMELQEWEDKGIINYLGETNDVRPFIENSFVIVLPSYHEGQGRVLVEAMAMGRAVLATDVPGCRQTVDNGLNGFLVPVKNSDALAKKMIEMYKNTSKTMDMSKNGFTKAHDVFDVNIVNNIILEEIRRIY